MMFLNANVFDDLVSPGATTFYTSSTTQQALGDYDQLAIQAVIDNVDVAGTFTLSIQHSADGENWVNKNATPEINAKAIATAAVTNIVGADTGATPTLGFVRFAFSIATASRAHVKLYATLRNWVR